jgi:DNA-binding MarR family transcriptional regulator
MSDLSRVFEDLVRAETRLYNAVDERLRSAQDLTLGQFEFLSIIDRRPGCRVLDIVREVGITVGAASKAVDRLEAAGWCRRAVNQADRRSSVLTLTPSGSRTLGRARPTYEAALAEHFEGMFSERALGQLAGSLAKLRAALERKQIGRV